MKPNFMTPQLQAHIEAACEKHEIREPNQSKIMNWAATTRDGLERALLESVESGMIEIVGVQDDGEPLFRINAVGEKHVQNLLKNSGHKSPGEFLGLE